MRNEEEVITIEVTAACKKQSYTQYSLYQITFFTVYSVLCSQIKVDHFILGQSLCMILFINSKSFFFLGRNQQITNVNSLLNANLLIWK